MSQTIGKHYMKQGSVGHPLDGNRTMSARLETKVKERWMEAAA